MIDSSKNKNLLPALEVRHRRHRTGSTLLVCIFAIAVVSSSLVLTIKALQSRQSHVDAHRAVIAKEVCDDLPVTMAAFGDPIIKGEQTSRSVCGCTDRWIDE
ncbi:MAG: hypothetical protein AAF664_19780 [Planctomycetota bacterium]